MKPFYLIPDRYLVFAIQVLAGITTIVPLVTHSEFYFPFIVPRNLLFRILVEVMVLLYIVLVLQNRHFLPRRHPLWIALAIFTGLITFSSLVGVNIWHSFWSGFERMDGLFGLYHLIAFFFVLYGSFRSRLEFERYFQISLFIAIILGLVGISQMIGVNLLLASQGGERVTATLGNATYLAAYMLIHLFFAAYFILRREKGSALWFYKYGFLGLDIVIIILHIRFWMMSGRSFIGHLFSNPVLWIPFLVLQVIAIGHFWYQTKDQWVRVMSYVFYALLVVLFLINLANTQTRGALVGFGIALLLSCILIVIRRGERRNIRVAGAVLATVGVLAVIMIFVFKDSAVVTGNPVLMKIASISLSDRTTLTRLVTWKAGLKGFADRPLFGWGLENFHEVFNKYFPAVIYVDEGTPLWFDRPHNILVQYLAEGGIVTLVSYLWLLGIAIYVLLRRLKMSYTGILFSSLIVAYVGQNLFVFDSVNSSVPFFAALAFVGFLTGEHHEHDESHGQAVGRTLGLSVGVVVLVLVVFSVWQLNIAPGRTNTRFAQLYQQQLSAGSSYNSESANAILHIIDEAGYLGRAEIIGAYSEYVVDLLRSRTSNAVPAYELSQLVDGLMERFNRYLPYDKTDARFQMFFLNLYINAERLNKQYLARALELSKETKQLSPTRPQVYYVSGRAHMIRNEYEEGLADFQHAVQLAPDIFDAHWNMFAAFVTVGDEEKALQEFAELKRTSPFGSSLNPDIYSRIVGVYAAGNLDNLAKSAMRDAIAAHPASAIELYVRSIGYLSSLGKFSLAQELLSEAVAQYPDAPELYAALAEILANQGKDDEARAAVEKAVQLDPSYEADAKRFLQLLEEGKLRRAGR